MPIIKMEIVMEEEIERFDAVSENNDRFTIICFEHITTTKPVSGVAQRCGGTIRYETTCGHPVNACEDPNQFEIVQTDQVVRRV